MNEDILKRYREILGQATAGSSTESLMLGSELEEQDMERARTMIAAELEKENDALRAVLQDEGVDTISTASIYRPGTEKFTQKWPFDPRMPMFIPFDQMDRETQFYTLSAAWSGRRAEGWAALHTGKLDEAEAIFQECLGRAEQMDVQILRSQSFRCLAEVAKQRGDRVAERKWLSAARKAHEAHQARS